MHRPDRPLVSKVKNLPTIIKCLVTAKEYTDPSEWSIVPRRPNEPVASHMWTTLCDPLKSFSYKIRQDRHCNAVQTKLLNWTYKRAFVFFFIIYYNTKKTARKEDKTLFHRLLYVQTVRHMHIRHIRRTNFDSFCPLETNFPSLTNVARATNEQVKESFFVYESTRDLRFLTDQSEKSGAFAVSKIVFFFCEMTT